MCDVQGIAEGAGLVQALEGGGFRMSFQCGSGCSWSEFSKAVHSLSLLCFAESHQVLAQLLDTLLVIGTKLPENPSVRMRLVEVACKVRRPLWARELLSLPQEKKKGSQYLNYFHFSQQTVTILTLITAEKHNTVFQRAERRIRIQLHLLVSCSTASDRFLSWCKE